MATEVILPRVDMDMAEGKIAYWHVQDGEAVEKGQVLFDIETDKATMEVDAPAAGILDIVRAELDVAIPVGEVVAWIRAAGEAPAARPPAPVAGGRAAPDAEAEVEAGEAEAEAEAEAVAAPAAAPRPAGRADVPPAAGDIRATPLARSQARALGIDLATVAGSGPRGRVVAADLPPAPQPGRRPAAGAAALHLQVLRGAAAPAPLLLIHGFGSDQASWRPLVQALAAEDLPAALPVLGVDLPGHGKSPALPDAGLEELAQAVLDAASAHGWQALHVAGHSLGGAVALALARLQPARVRSLTLLAPAGLGPQVDAGFIGALVAARSPQALREALAPLFHDGALLTESFVATAWQQLSRPGRAQALAALAQALMPEGRQARDLRPVLAQLRVPVRLVWGREDRVIPCAHAEDVPGHVAVHRLAGVGHLPQVEACALVARLVAEQVRAAAG